jgi:hypothetical protein
VNLIVSEIGYDFSYESYVEQPNKTIDPVSIHSARVFIGEALKISPSSGATASVEALFNLNHETNALDAGSGSPPTKGVSAFHDTRVVGKLGLTTTLLRYDQNPAPRPVPPGNAFKSHVCTDVYAVRGQGGHLGRGNHHLHVHLRRPRPARAFPGPLLDLGEADALSLPG